MIRIPWLDDESPAGLFPPLEKALNEPNGLLAAGGNLSSETLLAAYHQGIFPWFNEGEPLLWWSPDPRCVLFPEKLHISQSMKKVLKNHHYDVRLDSAFAEVIQACAETRKHTTGTWISIEMQQAYCRLYELGYAHSVECFENENLLGGLYGISLGECFFGESMFSRKTNTSKIALVLLVKHLRARGIRLIDCQVTSDHLISFGAEEIPRTQFASLLEQYVHRQTPIGLWDKQVFEEDAL
ncbi:MAG: leucyl/phenylalanyl-tRNA--protein transferase [Pseudomonadales bacterium]|nr:leucyl/phenylalanyl-tRNA--protein transferase [Pseudomonadales bacterium]